MNKTHAGWLLTLAYFLKTKALVESYGYTYAD